MSDRHPTPIGGAVPSVVVLRDATVRFGDHPVLDAVGLTCPAGTVLELRGRNGSGKTTLLRLLAGVRRPTTGRRTGPRQVAFVPAAVEPPAIPVAAWLGAVRPRRRSVAPVLARLGFTGSLDAPCRSLSYGNLRKVLLADAFTADTLLVVVDEAREGLDPAGLAGLEELVRDAAAAGAAVVLADQAVHPALPGAELLVVGAGRIDRRSEAAAAEAEVRRRGPAVSLPALRDQARRLGFAEIADPDGQYEANDPDGQHEANDLDGSNETSEANDLDGSNETSVANDPDGQHEANDLDGSNETSEASDPDGQNEANEPDGGGSVG
ncbi:MAG: ATP-binding cassette domain-containing protein [Acidimicrobiales bacterium]